MTDPSVESVLHSLTQGLEPVKPIPRLRSVLLTLCLVFGVALVMNFLWLGLNLAPASAWQHPPFLLLLAGLGALAAGAMLAAAAGAVPGRERGARTGRIVAAVGALGATLGGVLAFAVADTAAGGSSVAWGITAMCACRAAALGTIPAAVLCIYLARAFERRPGLGSILACVGALGLGGALVHASCAAQGATHMVVGHWLAPLALALLLALPFSVLIRRRRERAAETSARQPDRL